MIDKITQLVKEYSDDAIVRNPEIPNEKNDMAINETASSLMNQLSGKATSGDPGSIIDLFKKDQDINSNPAVNKITDGVAGDLMKKLGINSATATAIVSKIVPVVLAKMKNKTNDPNDNDFNLDEIIGSFGKGGGLLDSVKNIFGKKD